MMLKLNKFKNYNFFPLNIYLYNNEAFIIIMFK